MSKDKKQNRRKNKHPAVSNLQARTPRAAPQTNDSNKNKNQYEQITKWVKERWRRELIIIVIGVLGVGTSIALFFESCEQTKISNDTLDTANKSVNIENRPYIVIKEPPEIDSVIVGLPIDVRVLVRNSGKTPAMNIRVGIKTHVPLPDDPPTLDAAINTYFKSYMLGSETEILLELRGNPISKQKHDTIVAGKVNLFVIVIVQYDDLFGGKSTVNFCLRYSCCPRLFESCDEYKQYDYKYPKGAAN